MKRKIQHFLWKCINNSVPVMVNVQKHGIKCNPECCYCGEKVKTVEHILFECSKAEETWKLAPINWEGLKCHTQSMKQWWMELAKAGNMGSMKDKIEVTAYIIWNLWKARNAWHFYRTEVAAWDIVNKAVHERNEC